MGYDTLPERSRRYVFTTNGVVRLRCECCDHPTVPLAPDALWDGVDWASTGLACPLCNWENAPAHEDGTAADSPESAEDRNDGVSLEAARANFARHAWVYDPADPPPWMGGAPPAGELALRRALRDAYSALGSVSERAERGPAWERIFDLEYRLRAAETARQQAAESDWAAADDADAAQP